MGVISDYSAQNNAQRPVSVQEQPINFQRPLFSVPVGSGNSSGSESASSTNLFNTTSIKILNDFNSINDSFFNHTLNSITSSLIPISTSTNGFLHSDFNAADVSHNSTDPSITSAGSFAVNSSTVSAIGRQGLPLPIGNGSNINGSKNYNKECTNSTSNITNSNINLTSVDTLQERPYDPFGKSMPFELKFSSLKL